MARATNSVLLHRVRGKIGNQVVVKQYGSKTVLSKYPDMSGVKPSKRQKKQRNSFADAIAYAQAIIRDPVKKAVYNRKAKKKDQDAYHYAIQEFLRR